LKALVLSGGGSKGAYQAGILHQWMGSGCKNYDIFSGVSVGAINATHLAMYKKQDSARSAFDLVRFWSQLTNKDVKKDWKPFGKIHAIWKKSVYNTSPLENFLRDRISARRVRRSGNKLFIGAVSLTTGKYKVFDESHNDLTMAVLASSAFPLMLSPIKIGNQWWTDGGVRNITPLKSAIDAGATEIDVIMTSPEGMDIDFDDKSCALDVGMNAISIMTDEIMENDIKIARMITDLVDAGMISDKRSIQINVIRPNVHLTDNSLDFSPYKIKNMIDIGKEQAQQ